VTDERVYRFEFPERPGALLKFLRKLGKSFNISLFHYRNHGAAYGRVLVGLQITADEREQLQGYLEELGYRYWDETDNTVYQRFLR
jgi:threonine dehydratase